MNREPSSCTVFVTRVSLNLGCPHGRATRQSSYTMSSLSTPLISSTVWIFVPFNFKTIWPCQKYLLLRRHTHPSGLRKSTMTVMPGRETLGFKLARRGLQPSSSSTSKMTAMQRPSFTEGLHIHGAAALHNDQVCQGYPSLLISTLAMVRSVLNLAMNSKEGRRAKLQHRTSLEERSSP